MHLGNGTVHRRAAARVAVVAVAMLAWVTGCTGSTPTPTPATGGASESPVQTPTPTATPTVDLTVPPVRPEAMETPSADGAAAAATYFLALYPYVYSTNDLSAWTAMSEETCSFCSGVRDDVTAMVAEGGSDTSATMLVTMARGTEIIPTESYSATLRVEQGPSDRLDRAGHVLRSDEGGRFELFFALAWRDGWYVREVDTKVLEGQT